MRHDLRHNFSVLLNKASRLISNFTSSGGTISWQIDKAEDENQNTSQKVMAIKRKKEQIRLKSKLKQRQIDGKIFG
jgi:hypothetical protein